jgi:hypothetical protein
MSGTAVGGIAIPIFAVDNATAVINRVNKSIAGMTQGTQRFGAATKKSTDVSALNHLSLSMKGLGTNVMGVFRASQRVVPLLGVIASGSIVGGVAALERRWAELGQAVSNTSVRLGITTSSLTAWQGAARLAGASSEDMTAGLASLDEKLRSATFRGDAMAIQTFNKLRVNFGQIGVQARTADSAMRDVAEGISRIYKEEGRGAAFRAAQNLGLEALFPQLIKGGAAWDAYIEDVKRLGGVMTPDMIERAEKLRNGFSRLGIAVEGFANRISDALEPVMTPLLNSMAELVALNGTWISQDIGKYARELADYVKNIDWTQAIKGAESFWGWLKKILEYAFPQKNNTPFGPENNPELGGRAAGGSADGGSADGGSAGANSHEPGNWLWQWYRGGYAARPWWLGGTGQAELSEDQQHPYRFLPNLHWPHFESTAGGGRPITVPQGPSAAAGVMQQVHDFFAGKGVPEENIAGILANVSAESGFNPNIWNPEHTSFGLFQDTGDRLTGLNKRYGETPSVADQLANAWGEPQVQAALRAMRNRNSTESGAIFSRVGESPAGGISEDMRRGAASPQFMQGAVQVDVNIRHDGTTTANAKGRGIAQVSPPRVSSPMPGYGF